MFALEALALVPLWNSREIVNLRYRIHFTHHFDEERDGKLTGGWTGEPRERVRNLIRRVWEYFEGLNDPENRIVFFRFAHEGDLDPANPIYLADAWRLKAALSRIFTRAEFRIAFVNYPALEAEAAAAATTEFIFLTVDHKDQPDWMGPPELWAAALRRLPFRYRPKVRSS